MFEPNLNRIVMTSNAEDLEKLVNAGTFKGLNLNDRSYNRAGLSLIQICARLMSLGAVEEEQKKKFNIVYQILLYGGIETTMQELVYNGKVKSAKVAEVATGWLTTLTSGLATVLNKTGISDAVGNAANAGCDAVYGFLKEKMGEEILSNLGGGLQAVTSTGANLSTTLLNAAWEILPDPATRITNRDYRSQIMSKGATARERHYVLLHSLPNCSATSMSLSLFLLSKTDQTKLAADYADKELQGMIVELAKHNDDHKAVFLLLDEVFTKTKMPAKERADLVCNLVIGALEVNNPNLVDNLLIYYKAQNRSDYEFLEAISANIQLKEAFANYLENNKAGVQAFKEELEDAEDGKLLTTTRIKQYNLSRQALAYYKEDDGETLLHLFVRKASLEQVSKMVLCGVDLNAKDRKKHTALYHAATEGANKNENQERYIEIIKTLVYGDVYDLFKDVGHNIRAKTEGTILHGVGDIFGDKTGANFRRLTSEQSDLSQDKDAVIEMMKWLPVADLNFVMFYLVKRWPDKVLEWKSELLHSADSNPHKLLSTTAAALEMAGYSKVVNESTALDMMVMHIDQAGENLQAFLKEMREKDYGFLPKRLGYNLPEHFYKITEALFKGTITTAQAKDYYAYYTDVYAKKAYDGHKDFKKAVNDVLDRGFTGIKKVPQKKTPAELLIYLAENMYEDSEQKTAFIAAIERVNTEDVLIATKDEGEFVVMTANADYQAVRSLQAVGENIIKALRTVDAGWEKFEAAAQTLWLGELSLKLLPTSKEALPPVVKEVLPPEVKEALPPVVKKALPPVVKKALPPVVKKALPPVVKEALPPVVKKALPPVVKKALPPEVKEALPPVVKEALPPEVKVETKAPVVVDKDKNGAEDGGLVDADLRTDFDVLAGNGTKPEEGEKKPEPKQVPTWKSIIFPGLASACALLSAGDTANRLLIPYLASSMKDANTQAFGCIGILGLIGGMASILAGSYKYPAFAFTASVASTGASLYWGNNENTLPVIVGGCMSLLAAGLAWSYKNDKTTQELGI